MSRYRLVTTQNEQHPFTSGLILSEQEANEQLDAEAVLHSLAGWKVEREQGIVYCRKGATRRTIFVRQSDPMNDETERNDDGTDD